MRLNAKLRHCSLPLRVLPGRGGYFGLQRLFQPAQELLPRIGLRFLMCLVPGSFPGHEP